MATRKQTPSSTLADLQTARENALSLLSDCKRTAADADLAAKEARAAYSEAKSRYADACTRVAEAKVAAESDAE